MEICGTYTKAIYSNAKGKIELRIDVNGLSEFDIYTTVWVVYPDGVGEECVDIQAALAKLES